MHLMTDMPPTEDRCVSIPTNNLPSSSLGICCGPHNVYTVQVVHILIAAQISHPNLTIVSSADSLDVSINETVLAVDKVANLGSPSFGFYVCSSVHDLIRLACLTFVSAHPANIAKQ